MPSCSLIRNQPVGCLVPGSVPCQRPPGEGAAFPPYRLTRSGSSASKAVQGLARIVSPLRLQPLSLLDGHAQDPTPPTNTSRRESFFRNEKGKSHRNWIMATNDRNFWRKFASTPSRRITAD